MKKLLLLLTLTILLGCSKEEEEVLIPTFELTLNGNVVDTETTTE